MTFDRADSNIVARNPCVTVSFMIQEKLFGSSNKRGEIAAPVRLSRASWCWPASTQGFRYLSCMTWCGYTSRSFTSA